DAEILERLVALNTTRAAEEAQGTIRWLRPDFQCPESIATQTEFSSTETRSRIGSTDAGKNVAPVQDRGAAGRKTAWPKALPDQVRALRAALAAQMAPITAEELARTFSRARTDRVADLLETLAALGQARLLGDGRYSVG
ncbi:MAG: class I SAM-dependent DNA methyltransferase, partial [Verrucomicrobiota bacterium]|nr:class I SAM-dependent DNA methyltransferase [Verrucomicrobiota bacterium]